MRICLSKPKPPKPVQETRRQFLLVLVWAVFATMASFAIVPTETLVTDMGIPPKWSLYFHRKELVENILFCQADVWQEARRTRESNTEDSFSDRLGALLDKGTTKIPQGHIAAFHVWLSTRLEDWIDPPFVGRTNLVLVSLDNQRYGESFQWWSNGVLYATSDSDLSNLDLDDAVHWKSSISYRGSGYDLWWKPQNGDSLFMENEIGLWDIPKP